MLRRTGGRSAAAIQRYYQSRGHFDAQVTYQHEPSALVDHESTVGDYAHVAVNATVAGRCAVGRNTLIGAGAVVVATGRCQEEERGEGGQQREGQGKVRPDTHSEN